LAGRMANKNSNTGLANVQFKTSHGEVIHFVSEGSLMILWLMVPLRKLSIRAEPLPCVDHVGGQEKRN